MPSRLPGDVHWMESVCPARALLALQGWMRGPKKGPSSKAPSWGESDHIWEMGAGVVRLVGGGALSGLALHRSHHLSCQEESRRSVELEHKRAMSVSFTAMNAVTQWRRKWQPIPVFLPGKSHGQWGLAGCSSWGCKRVGLDLMTKQHHHHSDSDRLTRSWCSLMSAGKDEGRRKEEEGGGQLGQAGMCSALCWLCPWSMTS